MRSLVTVRDLLGFKSKNIPTRIGRRPVVLIGIFGVTISIFLFGLSKTFFGLLFSRGLSGALNGNIGVLKSMVTEITTEDNQAKAWSFAPIVFAGIVTQGRLSNFPLLTI